MKKVIVCLLTLLLFQSLIFNISADNSKAIGTYAVNTAVLNSRKGPSTDYDLVIGRWGSVKRFLKDEVIYIDKIENNWGHFTDVDEVSGWISLDYAKKVDLSEGAAYDGSTEINIKKTVIDVSEWNGNVYWNEVKKDNIYGTVIRIGRTTSPNMDSCFEYNYYNAVYNNIQTGCYFYSYARTVEKAKEDANKTIKFLKSKNYVMTLPIYYDMEDPYIEHLSKKQLTDITYTYCKTLKDAGYMSGVYCNKYWAEDKLDMDRLSEFEVWIAQWASKCTYKGNYGMWQYSETGSVKGNDESRTDMDLLYKNYPYLIRLNNLNGLSLPKEKEDETSAPIEPTTPPSPPTPVITSPIYNVKCSDGTYNHRVKEWTEIKNTDENGNIGTKKGYCSLCKTNIFLFYTKSEDEKVIGDIDFNGVLNNKDVRLLLKYIAKLEKLSTEQLLYADVNKDSKINALDCRKMLRVIAMLENF